MDIYKNGRNMPYVPTDTADIYPETDGEPMAASDFHSRRVLMVGSIQISLI